jgi:hypothetical protein
MPRLLKTFTLRPISQHRYMDPLLLSGARLNLSSLHRAQLLLRSVALYGIVLWPRYATQDCLPSSSTRMSNARGFAHQRNTHLNAR